MSDFEIEGEKSSDPEKNEGRHPKCIAFCDDDMDILEVLKEAALEMGHEPYVFSNAKDFAENIELIKPDLIVTDIRMPGLNGIELAGLIRDAGINIPMIFLTGDPAFENYRRENVLEQIGFLSKPFLYDQLHSAIARAFRYSNEVKKEEASSSRLRDLLRSYLRSIQG